MLKNCSVNSAFSAWAEVPRSETAWNYALTASANCSAASLTRLCCCSSTMKSMLLSPAFPSGLATCFDSTPRYKHVKDGDVRLYTPSCQEKLSEKGLE